MSYKTKQKSRNFQSSTNNANTSEHGKMAELYLLDPLLALRQPYFKKNL